MGLEREGGVYYDSKVVNGWGESDFETIDEREDGVLNINYTFPTSQNFDVVFYNRIERAYNTRADEFFSK